MTALARSTQGHVSPADFVRANSDAYEWLVERARAAYRRRGGEPALHAVHEAAEFASQFHPGRFADGAIEGLAFDAASFPNGNDAAISAGAPRAASTAGRRSVLHVASVVVGIGGHTRMVFDWARSDRTSHHSLVVLNQGTVPVPDWLREGTRACGVDFIVLPPYLTLLGRARSLRQLARERADLVVLHHAGSDPVPTLALAEGGPPVAVLNHADHEFWLGSSVADIVVSLRAAGAEHTRQRRYVARNTVIPIVLSSPKAQMSRSEARRALGIAEHETVLLSVGRARKYRACGPYDFVATANKILEREPGARMFVVGESEAGIRPHLRVPLHQRLHFVGRVDDPSVYRAAADAYVESFPFGSQTALLEAALSGLPVVPAYAPLFTLLVANDDAICDLLPNPPDEEEYVARARELVGNRDRRLALGATLRERLLESHVGEGWTNRLAGLYRETDSLRHQPRPVPATPCLTTDADVGLALWRIVADGRTTSAPRVAAETGALLRHSSYVARVAGNHAAARRYAWGAVRNDPGERSSWRLLAVSQLRGAGTLLRRVLRRPVPPVD